MERGRSPNGMNQWIPIQKIIITIMGLTPINHNVMKTPIILPQERMSYKEQSKQDELIAKFRVITDVKLHGYPKTSVANKYCMHRNTVNQLIKSFENNICLEIQHDLLNRSSSFTEEEINKKLFAIKNKSRKPHSNKRTANKKQESIIKKYFYDQNVRVGYNRMNTHLKRRNIKLGTEDENHLKEIDILKPLTYSQLKGIYKRNKMKVKKVKTANKSHIPLYDYKALGCFEKLHYDTKSILDKKALPIEIYNKFKSNKDIPIIEWNLIDVKSRFRFIAYSHGRTSEFGLHFLLIVIQFLRAMKFTESNIIIGTDNGTEFFRGSEKKKAEWNKLLNILNAEIYSYNPGFDVRKNLIERSHRTDDEEFLVPRGQFINDKESFMIEAKGYSEYFNKLRPHSGIEMHDMTPIEKIKSCGVYHADRLLEFPTMILEHSIGVIKKYTEIIRVTSELNDYKAEHKSFDSFDQKFIANLKANYKKITLNAHYVLTYYQIA